MTHRMGKIDINAFTFNLIINIKYMKEISSNIVQSMLIQSAQRSKSAHTEPFLKYP